MKSTSILIEEFKQNVHDDLLKEIYVDEDKLDEQRVRYCNALHEYERLYGCGEVSIYSAPGRSEIGGNHTDHQHGEVLAAAINLDAIAIVSKIEEPLVRIVSGRADMLTLSLDDLSHKKEEEGTTKALIKGVLAGIQEHGYKLGGFHAYITSDVLIGAGLSSSAAFETILGTIMSGLYNEMSIPAIEIAIIGQYAENQYFGKPCGLMDQMACSVGSLVHIDFADPKKPLVEKVEYDLSAQGYSLCIVDTKGSHAGLTDDYAAIPLEMKQVASFFGREFMSEVSAPELLSNIHTLRETTSDRAILRAIHFLQDNARVRKEVKALQQDDFPAFLKAVKASGDSSFKYLQNVYTSHDIEHQNLSLALAVCDLLLSEEESCRVHGGGFAGTIQAFVKNEHVKGFKIYMDRIFGSDACSILKIRKYGGMHVL